MFGMLIQLMIGYINNEKMMVDPNSSQCLQCDVAVRS